MNDASVTLYTRTLRGIVVVAAALLLIAAWWVAQARAGHDPDNAVHVCVAGNGTLRLAETCGSGQTELVLATGAGLQAAEARIADLEALVEELEFLLAGVARVDDEFGRDTLRFTGVNLQVVNGTGSTGGDPNGLGNLIIGYNAARDLQPVTTAGDRVGSHYLIVGDRNHWTRFGGIVAGRFNTASGDWASVTGGEFNTASGSVSSVTGGSGNAASGFVSSVTGGGNNTAGGSVSSVTGGTLNTASALRASVSGGSGNTASGDGASILGGLTNEVTGTSACHPDCS